MSIELQIALPNTVKIPRVSAALVDDGGCDTLMILAPGAGAGMHHRFMTGIGPK